MKPGTLEGLRGRLRGSLCIAATATSLLVAKPASAQYATADPGPALLGGATVLAAPPLVANTIYIARQKRPPLIWPILGFGVGSTEIAFGLAFAIPNLSAPPPSVSGLAQDRDQRIGLGMAHAALGLTNILLGVWAILLPKPAEPAETAEWSVAPFVSKDTAGVTFSLTRF